MTICFENFLEGLSPLAAPMTADALIYREDTETPDKTNRVLFR